MARFKEDMPTLPLATESKFQRRTVSTSNEYYLIRMSLSFQILFLGFILGENQNQLEIIFTEKTSISQAIFIHNGFPH